MRRPVTNFLHLCLLPLLFLGLASSSFAQEPSSPGFTALAAPPAEAEGTVRFQDAGAAGGAVDLALDDAVARALEKNLDIAVERLSPQTYDLSLAGLLSRYRPTVSSTFGRSAVVQLPRNQLTGGERVESSTLTYNSALSQNVRWGGGNVSVGWTNSRGDSTSTFNTFNPQFNSTLTATYVQPLLRNFGTDSTRSQIRVTNLNREISEVQLRATITNTVSSVRSAYWDLLYAREAVAVARRSLSLAEKLIEDNRVRVEFGTMAPIDVVEAQAEAATRRQQVAQAEAVWRTAELALKRLIVDGTDDPFWRAEINPIDRPLFQPEPIDVDAAIREAISKRTDITSVRRQRDINDANIALLRNQVLPSVDVVASYGLQGIGGTQLVRSSSLGGSVVQTVPGGYRDALGLLFGRDYPNWNVQLQFSQPIGQSAAAANYERAKVQLQQTRAEVNALELQIATEVTNIALQVQSNETRVEAATAARELALQRLEAEQSKFEVGMSTNFFVVQAQRDLADAEIVKLRAELDYRKSLVDFERVQQTSLTRAGITLVSSSNNVNGNTGNTGGGSGGGGTFGGGTAGGR